MTHRARVASPVAALVVIGALLACGGEFATPQPGTPPPEPPDASAPIATMPTPLTEQPTAGPESTPPPTAPPAATAPAPSGGWREIDFPAGDALAVQSVVGSPDGFVAVGAEPAAGEGPDGVRQGVIWTSSDGLAWQRLPDDPAFHGASLDSVVELDGTTYVFGFHSTCPAFDDECPALADAGNAAWRGSLDGGWTRLALPSTLRTAAVDGVAATENKLIVRGTFGDEVKPALWLSDDGDTWALNAELAGMDYVGAVASADGRLVALGTSYDDASGTIASRAGVASSSGEPLAPASVPDGLSASILGVARGSAGLVAVGNTVPNDLPEGRAVVLASADGRSWTSSPDDAFAGSAVAAIHATANGYVVVGTQALLDGRLVGRAWWSDDGSAWLALPGFDTAPFTEFNASALGLAGAVAFAVELSGEEPIVRAWFAPAELFAAP